MFKITSLTFLRKSAYLFGCFSKNGLINSSMKPLVSICTQKSFNFYHSKDFAYFKNVLSSPYKNFTTAHQGVATEACSLKNKHCIPCKGGVPPLTEKEIKLRNYFKELDEEWSLGGAKNKDDNSFLRLNKRYCFSDIDFSRKFINGLTVLAESEGHHPDITLKGNDVVLDIFTHKIQGLTESDFIFAAKSNDVYINLAYKADIEKDHPAYTDKEYIERR